MTDTIRHRCDRCHMEDLFAGALERIHQGTLESGREAYTWKHETIDGCLSALGFELSTLRERADDEQ